MKLNYNIENSKYNLITNKKLSNEIKQQQKKLHILEQIKNRQKKEESASIELKKKNQ